MTALFGGIGTLKPSLDGIRRAARQATETSTEDERNPSRGSHGRGNGSAHMLSVRLPGPVEGATKRIGKPALRSRRAVATMRRPIASPSHLSVLSGSTIISHKSGTIPYLALRCCRIAKANSAYSS